MKKIAFLAPFFVSTLFAANTLSYRGEIQNEAFKLSKLQENSGAFYPTQCSDKSMKVACRKESSIFTHSLIMNSLNSSIENDLVAKLKNSGLTFLKDQKAKHGDWVKYYQFGHPMNKILKNDVDDNAVIPATLNGYGVKAFPQDYAKELSKRAVRNFKMKRKNSDQEFNGQVFSTWMDPSEPFFKDVDVMVAANALWALGVNNSHQGFEDSCRFVNQVVDWVSESDSWDEFYNDRKWVWLNHDHYSVWYPSQYSFAYSVVRAYQEGKQTCLRPSVKKVEHLLATSFSYGESRIEQNFGLATLGRLIQIYRSENRPYLHLVNHFDQALQTENNKSKFFFYGAMGYIGSQAYESALKIEALSRVVDASEPKTVLDWNKIDQQVELGLNYFRNEQMQDGSWTKMIEVSSIFYNTFVIFMYEYANLVEEKKDIIDGMMDYIWSQQQANGGFAGYRDGEVDNGISVLAYVSAKIAGEDELSPRMIALENSILDHGGLENSGMKALPFLASVGVSQIGTCMPPALLNPLLSMDSMLPWPRVMLYPIYYVLAYQPVHELSDAKFPYRLSKRDRKCSGTISNIIKKNIFSEDKFWNWLVSHTNKDGTLFDYTPTSVPALMAYSTKLEKHREIFEKGIAAIESFQVHKETGIFQSPGEASIGESYVIMNALLDLNLPYNDPMMEGVEEFLYGMQQPNINGFGFSKNNLYFPDSDDTSNVVYVLKRLDQIKPESNPDNLNKLEAAMQTLLKFQNRDGGFSTWEKKIIPAPTSEWGGMFSGLPVLSESIMEHTARIVLNLSLFKDQKKEYAKSYQKAVKWLLDEQNEDGSYKGTWFVDYLFGTSMVLTALATDSENKKSQEAIEKALGFILSHQMPDGGFSESPASFIEEKVVPLSYGSSPSQTGLIVTQLLMFLREENLKHWETLKTPIAKAVAYLSKTQHEDGLWHDKTWTGVTFPKIEYLYYPYIQDIEPIHAMGMYKILAKK